MIQVQSLEPSDNRSFGSILRQVIFCHRRKDDFDGYWQPKVCSNLASSFGSPESLLVMPVTGEAAGVVYFPSATYDYISLE